MSSAAEFPFSRRLFFIDFSFGFAMAAIRQLKKTAAAMPAAPAVIPP